MLQGSAMKILLIEDDADTAAYIANGLREHGHVADHAADGRDGLFLGAGVQTPVLFLTTMDSIDDRVAGLEAGGDDYLVKPFAFAELLARLNALARRPPMSQTETVLREADLEMDLIA